MTGVPLPRSHWGGDTVLHRHVHGAPYAALVLGGGYEEAGEHGRLIARPGLVLLHRSWSGHRNVFNRSGGHILNLPLKEEPEAVCAVVEDPDQIVRLAEKDVRSAAAHLTRVLRPLNGSRSDWPDRLARALAVDPGITLENWAWGEGLRPETVSRGFRLAFGVTAARFRLEVRAARAARAIISSRRSLAEIAFDAGFADQAHMNRAVRALTRCSPARLRHRSIPFKPGQDLPH